MIESCMRHLKCLQKQLASELKGSVSNNNGMMSRDTMIDIVAMKLANQELEAMI
jgi:hypothetical protein